MKKCQGLFGWMFGHKFQARYDEERRPDGSIEMSGSGVTQKMLDSLWKITREYKCDVCVRCGEVAYDGDTQTVTINGVPTLVHRHEDWNFYVNWELPTT